MTQCQNGTCENNLSPIRRKVERTHDQEIYGRLWAEIELPKLLQRGENHE